MKNDMDNMMEIEVSISFPILFCYLYYHIFCFCIISNFYFRTISFSMT